MAIFKGKIRQRNSGGTYDYLLPETTVDMVNGLQDELDSKVGEDSLITFENSINDKLEIKNPFLNDGKIILPNQFKKIPFNIYKLENKWGSDVTSKNTLDWSDATNVYVKWNGTGADGLDSRYPLNLANFLIKFNNGVYGTSKKFVLHMLDSIYVGTGSNSLRLNIDADIKIVANNVNNFTWFGRIKNNDITPSDISKFNYDSVSELYKATQSNASHDILDIVNLVEVDSLGIPYPYTKVNSINECKNTEASFFRDQGNIYVNKVNSHHEDDLMALLSTPIVIMENTRARTIVFDNLGFLSSTYGTGTINNINSKFYAFNCKWYRGANNAFYIDGEYQVYLIDCVSAFATLDNFNYHSTSENSIAVEVNCIAYGSGRYKQRTNQPTHSNNASTAHDGMYMLRVGSIYSDAEGPIIADVDNCYSISIGCDASYINDTSTGVDASFYFYDTSQTTPATAKPKFVIECKGYGKNVEFGVKGTDKTLVKSFVGEKVEAGGNANWYA